MTNRSTLDVSFRAQDGGVTPSTKIGRLSHRDTLQVSAYETVFKFVYSTAVEDSLERYKMLVDERLDDLPTSTVPGPQVEVSKLPEIYTDMVTFQQGTTRESKQKKLKYSSSPTKDRSAKPGGTGRSSKQGKARTSWSKLPPIFMTTKAMRSQ